MRGRRWLFAAASILLFMGQSASGVTVKEVRKKMGSGFEITVVAQSERAAWSHIEAAYAEIERLEAMISSWRDDSETSAVNRGAGLAPVRVSKDLLNLVRRSIRVSELTGGAFDITFASFGRLWDFSAETPTLPKNDELEAALKKVGYQKVVVDAAAQTVFLTEPGMRIGFGAIGKGFAANRAIELLRVRGASSGVVNAGGDLFAFGVRESGEPWTVAIADPKQRDETFAYLRVSDQAVVTSGDYESFFTIDGERYAHILDPRTGYPVRGLKSVTVVCPDAELADALATSVFVLGPDRGLALVDRLKNVEALLVTASDELLFSRNLREGLMPTDRTVGSK